MDVYLLNFPAKIYPDRICSVQENVLDLAEHQINVEQLEYQQEQCNFLKKFMHKYSWTTSQFLER